jgi:hypothetical protein
MPTPIQSQRGEENLQIFFSLQSSFHPFARILGELFRRGLSEFFVVFVGCVVEKTKLLAISPAPLAINQMEP